MIITCPHCQTKYQVTYEAIGSAGRKVQCAHCHQAWNQDPTPPASGPAPTRREKTEAEADRLFDAMAEDALDDALLAEESAVAARMGHARPAPLPGAPLNPVEPARPAMDAAEMQKRQAAFVRRQDAMISSLPLARLRRTARMVGAVLLVTIFAGAYLGRVPIVERYPDLAGVYEAVGLGVNVVGLDFSNLETLRALSGGNDVLTVSAQIVGRSNKPVPVPPVVVSLLDANGHAVYEWSVTPRVADLMAGERATFDTRLSLPPSEAVRVRLTFAGRGGATAERPARSPGPSAGQPVPGITANGAPTANPSISPAAPEPVPQPAANDHL